MIGRLALTRCENLVALSFRSPSPWSPALSSSTTSPYSVTSLPGRFLSTSSSAKEQEIDNDGTRFFPVYVHHVSKMVLQHLQQSRSDWLVEQGLDKGLRLNANGTFVLQFPSTRKGFDAGRIWTSYDTATKQHFLSVYRQKLLGRFLLKDTSITTNRPMSATESSNAEQQLREVVDKMIATLNEIDAKRPQPKA